jgi:hypothetical protein
MKLHEIAGEFDQFVSELHAICKHDRVFAARIRAIARRHVALNKQTPRASPSDNAARMQAFVTEARRCCEERASELEGSSINEAS